MYGRVSGVTGASAAGVGAVVLPNTGDSTTLFAVASGVLAVGLITLAASGFVALISR